MSKYYLGTDGKVRVGDCPDGCKPLRQYKHKESGKFVYRDVSGLDADNFSNILLGSNLGVFVSSDGVNLGPLCLTSEVTPTEPDHVDVPPAVEHAYKQILEADFKIDDASYAKLCMSFCGMVVVNNYCQKHGANKLFTEKQLSETAKKLSAKFEL